jgi:hypothetical protein
MEEAVAEQMQRQVKDMVEFRVAEQIDRKVVSIRKAFIAVRDA